MRISPYKRRPHFRLKFGPPEEAEDQDLKVVEMGEQDDEVPFVFAIPRGRVATFTEEEDDEDASLSGTFGSGGQEGPTHRSARLDFPAVMTLAAERVGLPLPPPLPLRPVSRLRQGFYGPVHPAQPAFVSPPLPDICGSVRSARSSLLPRGTIHTIVHTHSAESLGTLERCCTVSPYGAGDSLRLPMGGRGGALSTVFRAHFSQSKHVGVCSVSRGPDFSTVTTEVKEGAVQRLLTRKPVRGSGMERCCLTTARVYIGAL